MISADNPIRFHHLKAFGRAPAAARYALTSPGFEPSASMERGTACHALLFGNRKVVAYEAGKQRRGKAWKEFKTANKDHEILTDKDYVLATGMVNALRSHARAMDILKGPGVVNEKTLTFELSGLPCRATPDAWYPDLSELKSTANASPEKFYWQVKRMGYHVQLGWYEIALSTLGYEIPLNWHIVAVEQPPPHIVQVFPIGPKLREEGIATARLWFEGIVNCYRSDEWPGYSQSDYELEISDTDDELIFADDEESEAA